MYKVCLVEDEEALANIVKLYLERAGYETVCFTKGKDAISYVGNKVDLWILDIMLGDDINGYDVIKAIREKDENVPVIFTSARDQELDKIFGLELGSDDYMTKPYSSKELVLRVNKLIKRVYKDSLSTNNIINYDNYIINLDKRIVELNNKEIKLEITPHIPSIAQRIPNIFNHKWNSIVFFSSIKSPHIHIKNTYYYSLVSVKSP